GHREHEERESAKVARLARVILHVAEREKVNEKSDRRHDQHHATAERIDFQSDVDAEGFTEIDPWEGLNFRVFAAARGQHDRENQSEERRSGRYERADAGPTLQAEQNRRRDNQWQQQNGPSYRVNIHEQAVGGGISVSSW